MLPIKSTPPPASSLVSPSSSGRGGMNPPSYHVSFTAGLLPRIPTSHELNWVEAAKGKTKASSPFEYAARLTEVMLLGVVSLRAGTKIHYDAAAMKITNAPAANQFLQREYRSGWTLSE